VDQSFKRCTVDRLGRGGGRLARVWPCQRLRGRSIAARGRKGGGDVGKPFEATAWRGSPELAGRWRQDPTAGELRGEAHLAEEKQIEMGVGCGMFQRRSSTFYRAAEGTGGGGPVTG
jgi:hypothetical protein